MDSLKKTDYWLDIADYDIKTARSMQKSGRYPSYKAKLSKLIDKQSSM